MIKDIQLNKKYGAAQEVNEIEFWQHYITLISINSPYKMTNTELVMLSSLMTKDPNKSYFKGERRKAFTEELGISKSRFTQVKNNLLVKGYIELVSDDKSDILPHKNLRNFKRGIDNKLKEKEEFIINFCLPFKIV